jgi:hypothetical protein
MPVKGAAPKDGTGAPKHYLGSAEKQLILYRVTVCGTINHFYLQGYWVNFLKNHAL